MTKRTPPAHERVYFTAAAFRAVRSFYFQGALTEVETGTLTMAHARKAWAWATDCAMRGCPR